MYGYSNPFYTPQISIDRINNQIKELESIKNQYQNIPHQNTIPTNLTQNFQLAPNNNNNNSNSGIRYANSIEDVKNELIFIETLFVNKEFTILWVKNVTGEIKSYALKEIIDMDEKDVKIAELMAKINKLESEKIIDEYTEHNFKNDVGEFTKQKSTNGKSNK